MPCGEKQETSCRAAPIHHFLQGDPSGCLSCVRRLFFHHESTDLQWSHQMDAEEHEVFGVQSDAPAEPGVEYGHLSWRFQALA